ncbi:MAG TPA: hypothetical protein VII25_14290, partial [Candidatus Acidoferrum sp.]
MDVKRRDIIKALFGGSAVAALATSVGVVPTAKASEAEAVTPLPEAVGLMYDATKCIGCRA